jgi:peptidoglycan/LPS O-acetylase OafA/YrhL
LSAYLITELLLRERARTGVVDVKAFYIRRILRSWPLYFFVIAIALAISLTSAGRHLGGWTIGAFTLFLGNIACALWSQPHGVIVPLWTVSMEEQFYILWPLVVTKVRRQWLQMVAVGLLAAATILRLILSAYPGNGLMIWFGTATRLDPFAIGMLIATTLDGRVPNFSRLTRIALAIFGLSLWFAAARYCDPIHRDSSTIGVLTAYPLIAIGAGLFLLSALGSSLRSTDALIWSTFARLGKISYGLYVYSLICLEITSRVAALAPGALGDAIYFLGAFGLTVVVSMRSYRWLESPFLVLKRRFAHVDSRPI